MVFFIKENINPNEDQLPGELQVLVIHSILLALVALVRCFHDSKYSTAIRYPVKLGGNSYLPSKFFTQIMMLRVEGGMVDLHEVYTDGTSVMANANCYKFTFDENQQLK